jgi:hypothetical protein
MTNKIVIATVFALTFNIAGAGSLFDKAIGFFKPAKDFTGISLSSGVKEIKELGFECEDGTDAVNGKVINFTICEDKKYRGDIFGLDVKGRTVTFVGSKLPAVKILKRDMFVTENSYEVLRKKLDTVYPKVSTPVNANPNGGYWDYGDGATLASTTPIKIQTDITDFSKFITSLGIVVTTPAGQMQ